jgi:poly-gamma-glutamate synthase PgsB/CapB
LRFLAFLEPWRCASKAEREDARNAKRQPKALLILLLCLAFFVLFLIYERVSLECRLRRIPLRIAVTGTRGKSSVARILASILSEDGRSVLCKTTGSQAMVMLPDGSQRELPRRGIPSIIEQITTVKKASHLRVDCLVAEVMSIHPENHFVEAQQILKPHVTVVTNVRLDHTEAMGTDIDEVASVLAADITPGSTVFIPDQPCSTPITKATVGSGSVMVKVSRGDAAPILDLTPDLARTEFPENLDLVCSVARHLNIDHGTIVNGIKRARYDVGRLKVWSVSAADSAFTYYLVNAFAANDPESTFRVLARLLELLPACSGRVTGVLNVRADRFPRTLQWLEALRGGALAHFCRLYVTGDRHSVIRKRLPEAQILEDRTPEKLMARITAGIQDGAMIFGFGNVKGAGILLAEHWRRVGTDYGI